MDVHEFTLDSFDGFVNASKTSFHKAIKDEDWDFYVNVCASISCFVNLFPERSEDYTELIVPLIKVCSDKIDKVRKNSATLMARLAMNEENKRVMVANHGMDVLQSIKGQLL